MDGREQWLRILLVTLHFSSARRGLSEATLVRNSSNLSTVSRIVKA